MAAKQIVRTLGFALLALQLHCSAGDSSGTGARAGAGGAPTSTSSSTSGSGTSSTSTGSTTSAGGATSGVGGSTDTTGAGGTTSTSSGGGVGGVGGTGSGGAAPRDGGGGPSFDGGVDPSKLTLSAYGANRTIGLEWPRVTGAMGYKLYWSNTAGVTPQSGTAIALGDYPTYVHRGVTNGTDYSYVITALTAAGEGPPSAEVTAKPGGEWALEFLGSGDFDDIVTGGRVPRVPIAKRAQILLLAEGYLQSELPVFHDEAKHNLTNPTTDVDRWQKELFGLEPYSKFQDAFVVWFLPRASTTHTDGGMSAFGTDVGTATGPLFAALGTGQFLFPPTAASHNFDAAFLLFDPGTGRAGVSGHTSSCSMGGIRVGCSFGIGHAHEFTHAFANVRDEYLDNMNSTSNTSESQNVVATNKCDQLPWAHLLAGRGINDTPQIVGAYGRPMQGYHSELHCHMNGTHDNGAFYCAGESLNMRVNRFCNFCRELIAFHVMWRTEVLPQPTESAAYQVWKTMYRQPFFTRFGFSVPSPLPQTVACQAAAKTVVEDCVP